MRAAILEEAGRPIVIRDGSHHGPGRRRHAVLFAATEKKLCGCILGSCNSLRDIPKMIRLWKQGLLDLEGMVTGRRPLAEINEGFADLAANRGIRTVIEID